MILFFLGTILYFLIGMTFRHLIIKYASEDSDWMDLRAIIVLAWIPIVPLFFIIFGIKITDKLFSKLFRNENKKDKRLPFDL